MGPAPLLRSPCGCPDRRPGWRPGRLASAIVAVVATATVASCGAPAPPKASTIPGGSGRGSAATVSHVVDGDTVDLDFGSGRIERARLLGIDTPETMKPDAPVECYGPEASARAKDLLAPGTEVLVQRDTEARDRYGRLLVYLWHRADGAFVNGSLVADGYARTLSIEPNDAHRVDLSAAAAAASAGGVGLWGACPPDGEATRPVGGPSAVAFPP